MKSHSWGSRGAGRREPDLGSVSFGVSCGYGLGASGVRVPTEQLRAGQKNANNSKELCSVSFN